MKQFSTKSQKTLAIILIVVFIVSLIPILYISKFTFPSEDDFSYGRLTKNIYKDTGSIIKVFQASFTRAIGMYKSWQGTFSGLIIMSVGPYIYGIDYYFLTPFILLFILISSTFFFTYKILKKILKVNIWVWISIVLVLLFAQIQFLQYPNSSFYWYNGSSLYMIFYCSALVVYGFMVNLLSSNKKKRLWLYLVIVPLSAFTSTGNFVISLNFAIITAFIVVYLLITKNVKWKEVLPIFIIALSGLIFITVAPGNFIRISQQNADASVIKAIMLSFKNAFLYIFKPHYLIEGKYFGAILVFLALPLFGKIIKNNKLNFRYPLAVILLSLCVFASVMTPTLYGLGNVKLPRVNNIIYFFYIWMILFDSIYLIGWVYRRINQKSPNLFNNLIVIKKSLLAAYFSIAFIMAIVQFLSISIYEPKQLPTSIRAVQVIRHKTGATFAKENAERIKLLASDENIIVFNPYTVEPDLLYYNDMGDDPEEWFNRIVAEYFDKDSIVVK